MKRVLIACQYATNKGDRAIAEYLIYQLRKYKDIQIVLSTNKPDLWDDYRNQGVEVIDMGYRDPSIKLKAGLACRVIRKLTEKYYHAFIYPDLLKAGQHKRCQKQSKKFIEQIQRADLVIVTGGHHITSIRSANALFDVTYDIGLISLFSKRYVLWSQTIGPLVFSNAEAKSFFGRVLRSAENVYIRDNNSSVCLAELYPNLNNVKKSYDSVFGFGSLEIVPYSDREKKIGISIFNGLPKAYKTFNTLAGVLDHYAALGYAIEFFRMEHHDKELGDIRTIIGKMKVKTQIDIFAFKTSALEHLKELAQCQVYIGYKTHSAIMSLATATPLLGICYHQKTRDFMSDYGLQEYAIDDEAFTVDAGVALIDRLIANSEDVHERMSSKSNAIAKTIERDLESMLFEGDEVGDDGE